MKRYSTFSTLIGIILLLSPFSAFSAQSTVEERVKKEEKIPPNYFTIAFYQPTYIMPYYYTGSPYQSIYQPTNSNTNSITHSEVKYQFSVKVPAWKQIANHPSTLYLAYSQLSYWQAYANNAFFRETDYAPEIFLANEINYSLFHFIPIKFLNFGMIHQSNGYGGTLERSWNRIYVEAIASTGNWMFSVRPWYIIHDNTLENHNPNIAKYLGYGQLVLSYKVNKQVFSLQTHNLIEGHGRRATAELAWSFPLTDYLKGYVQVFSGYGQSLIEYDHRTNSAGVGIALSDWI